MAFRSAARSSDRDWFEAIETPGDTPAARTVPVRSRGDALTTASARAARSSMHRFVLLLRQLASEFDAFGDGAQGQALFAQLETIAARR